MAKSEEEVKKLVPEHFYKWIHIFGKKQSERMPTRKLWDHIIETKERFVPSIMMHMRTNIFLFLLSIFLDLIFLFF